jgi:hypothetical protein
VQWDLRALGVGKRTEKNWACRCVTLNEKCIVTATCPQYREKDPVDRILAHMYTSSISTAINVRRRSSRTYDGEDIPLGGHAPLSPKEIP